MTFSLAEAAQSVENTKTKQVSHRYKTKKQGKHLAARGEPSQNTDIQQIAKTLIYYKSVF